MLPLDRVPIPWGGGFARVQRIEWCPVAKDPRGHAKLDQPHRVTLDLQRPVCTQEWKHVVTDRQGPVVARCYKPDIHGLLPVLAKPTANRTAFPAKP